MINFVNSKIYLSSFSKALVGVCVYAFIGNVYVYTVFFLKKALSENWLEEGSIDFVIHACVIHIWTWKGQQLGIFFF